MVAKRVQKMITFPQLLYQAVEMKAQRFGMLFPEYIRFLALEDVKKEMEDIPTVDEETERAVGESLEAYKQGDYVIVRNEEELDKVLGIKNKR